jgi:hypothetical protein
MRLRQQPGEIGQIDTVADSQQLDADGQVVRAVVDVAVQIDTAMLCTRWSSRTYS